MKQIKSFHEVLNLIDKCHLDYDEAMRELRKNIDQGEQVRLVPADAIVKRIDAIHKSIVQMGEYHKTMRRWAHGMADMFIGDEWRGDDE